MKDLRGDRKIIENFLASASKRIKVFPGKFDFDREQSLSFITWLHHLNRHFDEMGKAGHDKADHELNS